MKSKLNLNTIVMMTVVLIFMAFGNLKAQIANTYPFDSLIHNDPNVLFTEMFEQSTVPVMLSTPGYQTFTALSRIHLDPSVPAGSHGKKSLRLTTVEHSNASNDTMEDANIRINLPTVITNSVYIRYYIKYNSGHTFHHSGVWTGGTNTAYNCWTCVYPGRTLPVSGDSAFIVGTEIRGSANQTATSNSPFGFYNYWMGMKPLVTAPNTGKYFGNSVNSLGSNDIINMDTWNCIEMMIKLNNPVTDSNGELKLWINGNLIDNYGKGFPTGTWNEAIFVEGTGLPFEGFRWRSNSNVVLNYLWLKNYATQNISYPTPNDMWIDHVVVAKSYIGPMSTNTSIGINEPNVSQTISMYPNPANEIVKFPKTIKEVTVINAYGQIVLQAKNTESISIMDLQEGLYIIHADKTTQKIIVRH